MKTTTSRGGIPRRVCPECADDTDDWYSYGGNYQLVADGGRPGIAVGDWATDAEADADEELLVVREHDAPAEEVVVEGDTTVADYNPTYPGAARVVECVYRPALEEALDGWRSVEDVRDAVAFDAIPSYSFPAARLRAIDDEDDSGGMEAFL